MNSKTIVKAAAAASADVGNAVAEGREYRRPEVHDLGDLEQIQGRFEPTLYLDAYDGYRTTP